VSAAVLCDKCGATLRLDSRGDDEYGERSAWITLGVAEETLEACTTTCAIQLLQSDDIVDALADRLEAISNIARIIREGPDE
jgi:hypothetical protein